MLQELRDVLNIQQTQIPPNNEELIRMIRQQHQREQNQIQLAAVEELGAFTVIYDDAQNVHNTAINESVITAARTLIEDMIATVTFDGRYKINVFRDDTVKSITYKLADILGKSPKDICIMGSNNKQELQPKMTYKIMKNTDTSLPKTRFKSEEIDSYLKVMALEDYIFPENIETVNWVEGLKRYSLLQIDI